MFRATVVDVERAAQRVLALAIQDLLEVGANTAMKSRVRGTELQVPPVLARATKVTRDKHASRALRATSTIRTAAPATRRCAVRVVHALQRVIADVRQVWRVPIASSHEAGRAMSMVRLRVRADACATKDTSARDVSSDETQRAAVKARRN